MMDSDESSDRLGGIRERLEAVRQTLEVCRAATQRLAAGEHVEKPTDPPREPPPDP